MNTYDWYITPEEYRIAENNGIKRDTLEHRIRYHGWDKEKAITQPIQSQRKLTPWIKLAKENGISKGTFRARVCTYKWTLEKAATTPVGQARNRKYPKWVREEISKNGIKYYTFLKRIENGWDLERAYTEKTNGKLDALRKGRDTQKKLQIGPYKAINDYWALKDKKFINTSEV